MGAEGCGGVAERTGAGASAGGGTWEVTGTGAGGAAGAEPASGAALVRTGGGTVDRAGADCAGAPCGGAAPAADNAAPQPRQNRYLPSLLRPQRGHETMRLFASHAPGRESRALAPAGNERTGDVPRREAPAGQSRSGKPHWRQGAPVATRPGHTLTQAAYGDQSPVSRRLPARAASLDRRLPPIAAAPGLASSRPSATTPPAPS